MVTSRKVKNSVVLPALFLFYFIITLTGLSLLSLLQHLGRYYSGEGTFVLGWLPSSIRSMLPAAVFLSLFFLFFRMLKKPGSRLLTFILMLVTVAAALVGGNMGLHQILIGQLIQPLQLQQHIRCHYTRASAKFQHHRFNHILQNICHLTRDALRK